MSLAVKYMCICYAIYWFSVTKCKFIINTAKFSLENLTGRCFGGMALLALGDLFEYQIVLL